MFVYLGGLLSGGDVTPDAEIIGGYPYYPPIMILFNNTRSTRFLSSKIAL